MITDQRYDVFLSYSMADEATVEFLAHLLSDVGLQVWFDKWVLVPGQPWQKVLEEVMQAASAIIMCIGPLGLSPLQEHQYQSALGSQTTMQAKLLIPVLLPGVDARLLPYYLKDRQWIDLRNRVDDSRELTRLVSIIAQALLEESLRVALALYGEGSERVAAILSNLGGVLRNSGDLSTAQAYYQRALSILEHVLGSDHPDVATSLNNLAELYHDQGHYDIAEPLLQRALAIVERELGPDHPHVAVSLNNLASFYRAQGRYDAAEPYLQRALGLRERVLGPNHPDVATSLNSLASLYWAQGRYDAAEPLYLRALTFQEQAMGPDDPDVAAIRKNYTALLRDIGRAKADILRSSPPPVRILLADNHPIVRQGLRAVLEQAGMAVIGEASEGQEALRIAHEQHPDVAVLDIGMPHLNGLETARRLHEALPQTKIVFLTMHTEDPYVLEAVQAGAVGYVLKTQTVADIVQAIRDVLQGEVYWSPRVSRTVVTASLSRSDLPPDPLTSREREILQLIAEGETTKEIAWRLGLSAKTVESHRIKLMRKLNIHETATLIRYAIRRGLTF